MWSYPIEHNEVTEAIQEAHFLCTCTYLTFTLTLIISWSCHSNQYSGLAYTCLSYYSN